VIALLLIAACTPVCQGPGCEAAWPNGRLAVHPGGTALTGRLDVWESASTLYDGSNEDGAAWAVEGASNQLILGQPEAGVVSLLSMDEDALVPIASWTAAESHFGASIALNRSNRDEGYGLWVGGPDWSLGTGAVWLFRDAHLSTTAGLDAATADLRLNGGSPADRFGTLVAVCGDMTGDDQPEIAVTAPWFDAVEPILPVEPLAGAIFLLDSESLTEAASGTPPWELGSVYWGSHTGDGAGHAVACERDLTGDGVPDLAIGAPWYNNAAGRVYVIDGSNLPENGPLDDRAYRILEAPNPDAENWHGMSLVALQLFGDDASDLVVGTPAFASGQGRVLIYRGASLAQTSFPSPVYQIRAEVNREESDHLGRWLAVGRFYGGTRQDLVIGAPDYRGDGKNDYDTGQAWIWRGDDSEDWPSVLRAPDAAARFTGTTPFQRIGRRPAVFDIDGDDRDDLLLVTRTRADDP